MDESRISKRVPFKTTLHFGPPANNLHEHASFVTDISQNGLGIKTKNTLRPGKSLFLFIDYSNNVYEAKRVVVWVKNVSPMLSWFRKNRVGIKFKYADHMLVDLYKLEAGAYTRPHPEKDGGGLYQGSQVAEWCRNPACDKILFLRRPEDDKDSWTICSEDTPGLQSSGGELFYRCSHCKAKNRVYSDYVNRRLTISGIIPE